MSPHPISQQPLQLYPQPKGHCFSGKNPLALAIASTLLFGGATLPANAEQETSDEFEEVIVTGIRGSLKRAMDIKRDSTEVVDAIAAEDLGKFPDQNVAESLQRISGVSIDRNGGEGQYITVRGLGPQFNSVLVNGRQMATENKGREFSFDTLAAELISGADIFKSSASHVQDGGIGATVNVKTLRPLDIDGFKAVTTVKGVYEDLIEESAPQYTALVSNTFAEDTLGILVSVAKQERNVQNNIIETRYYRQGVDFTTNNGESYQNVFVPQNFDQMVDLQDRSRETGTAVIQYEPSSNIVLTLDAMKSSFAVDSDTHSLGHWFSDGNFNDVEVDGNGTVVYIDNANTGATDFIRRSYHRDTEMESYGFNVLWDMDESVTAELDISSSSAIENSGAAQPFTVIGYNNAYQWTNAGNGDYGTIDIVGGDQALLDASAGSAHYNERKGDLRKDHINEVKFNLEFRPDSDVLTSINTGLYFQEREKDFQNKFSSACSVYCGYGVDVPDFMLTEFNAGSYFGGVPNTWLTYDPDAFFAYISSEEAVAAAQAHENLDLDGDGVIRDMEQLFAASGLNQPLTQNNLFNVQESIISAFVSFDLEAELFDLPLTVNAGLRYSQTRSTLGGFYQALSDLQPIPLDPSDLDEVYSNDGSNVDTDNSYSNLLPNMNARLEINDDMVMRLAYSQTLTRPTMDFLVPTTTVTVSRPNNNEASGGNPDLKPFFSNNIDLAYEWYFAEASYFSFAMFSKQVRDFISITAETEVFQLASGDYDFNVQRPRNAESANITGFETSFIHMFDNGFGVQLNATNVNSDASLGTDTSETFALEGLGNSQNIVGFYEQGPLQARLAFNNREDFLQNIVNPRGGTEPLNTETYGQWDASASYDFTNNFTVIVEAVNITGETTRRYGRYRNQLISLEDNGARFALGVRAKF